MRAGLVGVLLLAAIALWIVWPQRPGNYLPRILPWPENEGIHLRLGDFRFDRQGAVLGLDLQGGTQLILEADLSQVEQQRRTQALEGVQRIIERRVNAFGVGEAQIQVQGENRLSIQLPGIRDIAQAKSLIGRAAKLDFRERVTDAVTGASEWVVAKARGTDGAERELTGSYLRPNSYLTTSSQSGLPEVAFEFDDEGSVLFEQLTTRLLGRQLGIFLDGELISAPTVQATIRSRGVITGVTAETGRSLAIQLNSGALPVPVSVVLERTVDATLGADSVRKSVVAGEVGMAMVILFMLLYYRMAGVLASVALIIYALLVLAIFKLIPVTLSLPAIAAFILSVGMAVDANILIFERTKEELRNGRTLGAAIDAGFNRAWSSIRDSNANTLIVCLILFWGGDALANTLVVGFAFTLGIGVVVSLFTAITVTRVLLHLLVGRGLPASRWLFGIEAAPGIAPAVPGRPV
ncbi:MAG: protein translocase subunit SecD [Chloroflexi bacterium]|nr:protein translocase subunit SecD [Chloroflexota bacterium]